jgi:hypothetical protein
MGFTTSKANAILDALCAGTLYVGLSTADPGNTGSTLAEPSGNNYARVAVASTDWNAAASRQKTNKNAIIFPAASGSWGTVSYFCLFDALTAGNLLASGAISPAQAVVSGNTMQIDANGATISIT